jgi:6-phosphogluconolactonase (cycloisomerase 2 family)
LVFKNWHFDSQNSFFLEDCIDASIGPDGNYLYVLGRGDDAISVLERNGEAWDFKYAYLPHTDGIYSVRSPQQILRKEISDLIFISSLNTLSVFRVNTDGSLKSNQQIIFNENSPTPTSSLVSTFRMSLSPDKNFLYTANFWDSSIGIFSIDEDGDLEFVDQISNGINIEGMHQPHSVSFSPDGQYAFISSYGDSQISIFRRNPINGKLTFLGYDKTPFTGEHQALNVLVSPDNKFVYIKYADGLYTYSLDRNDGELNLLAFNPGETIPRYSNNSQAIISKDGNYLYDLNTGDQNFIIYQRNPISGILNPTQVFQNGGLFDEIETIRNISYDQEMEEMYLHTSSGKNSYIQTFKRDLATGLLTKKPSIKNPQDFIHTLDKMVQSEFSPNQNYLYAASQNDNAINIFKRNLQTGELEFTGFEKGLSSGKTLDNLQSISISPDGKYLYAIAKGESVLMQFTIDQDSGQLSFEELYQENGDNQLQGLAGAYKSIISNDGRFFYISSPETNGILVFERNISNGRLSLLQKLFTGENGISGLKAVKDIAISKDDQFVFALGSEDDAMVLFEKSNNGFLNLLQVVHNNEVGTKLDFPQEIAFSPDGNQIYVSAYLSNSINIFDFDKTYGQIYFRKAIINEDDPNTLLRNPSSITLSPNGKFLLVGASGNEALNLFRRDENGNLNWEETIQDGLNNNQGISNVADIMIAENSNHIYTLDQNNDAIAFYEHSFSTSTYPITTNQWLAYPNPFKDVFRLDLAASGLNDTNFDLFDIYGKKLYSNKLTQSISTFNFKNLPKGAYLLKLNTKLSSEQQWLFKN